MKDDKLEKEFEEYFKGVNTPDDITRDAKKYVKPKRNVMPKFVKFASVAASFVLIFAVALTIILKADFNKADNDASTDSKPSQTPDISDSDNGFKFYVDGDIETSDANEYALSSLNSALRFIENFAIASNANVEKCEAGYRNGKLALVRADVNLLNGLSRDETTIFVEFTDKNLIYRELADYYDGEIYSYRGLKYYLTEKTGENGEPEFKLHVSYNGVKYYFNVRSSDKKAYEKYLNFVFTGNF